jgi:hypothetical protein
LLIFALREEYLRLVEEASYNKYLL